MVHPTEMAVLIVGAGPTGLALALELSLQEIPFRIVDRNPDRSTLSKALITQSRTLECLNRHDGLSRRLVAAGVPGVGIFVYANQRLAAEVDLHDLNYLDTEFPRPLWISQAELEREMAAKLTSYGHTIERGVIAGDFIQDGTGVTAMLRKNSGATDKTTGLEKIRARYVVGCDGARSTVRAASPSIKFDGFSYEQEFILCDTHVKWDKPPNKMHIMWGKDFMAAIPMRDGLVRLTGTRRGQRSSQRVGYDGGKEVAHGERTGSILTLETFQQAINDGLDSKATLFDPVYMSAFRLHHRVASSYRDGRIFLAGDAAHIHSPAGGQGMNTGIQDAVNLGWKLATIIRREDYVAMKISSSSSLSRPSPDTAPPETPAPNIIDSYSRERRPVGVQILKTTDRMFSFMVSTGWLLTIIRNLFFAWVVPLILSSRARRTRAFTFISQLRVRYRNSSDIVGTGYHLLATSQRGKAPIRGGDRCPNGRIEERIASGRNRIGGKSDDEAVGDQVLYLMDVCRPSCYHLVIFSGTKISSNFPWAASLTEKIQHMSPTETVKVHWVAIENGGDGGGAEDSDDQNSSQETYLDVDGFSHGLYGFGASLPGYIFVRPDQHVAHIGTHEDVDEFLDWARWYFSL